MPEFRYQGVSPSGKLVRGVLFAKSRREAKRRLREIEAERGIRVTQLQRRATFLYKVRKGTEKPIQGEQRAFSKEEVEAALRRMGYNVIWVRKKLLDWTPKPSSKDVTMFIRLSADLLREKFPYDEALQLLSSDIQNKGLRIILKDILQDLREGKDGREVFGKHEDSLGRFAAYMLGVASKSGNMAEIYESTAKFLERDQQFKKDLRSSLVMPLIIVFLLFAAIVYYVAYIFPATAKMFTKFNIPLPPLTSATLRLSDFLQHNILWMLGIIVALGIVVFQIVRSPKGRLWLDRNLIRIPVVGPLFHKTSIEIFSRVFHTLYGGSGESMEAIRIAAEACRNRFIEHKIKTVALPMMIRDGKGIVESLQATGVFPESAISRFRSGAETGTLKQAALQLAEYYEKETTYRMKGVIDFVNIMISMFIMIVMVGLTLVSSEIATIKIPTTTGF
ncbi:MAG: type II secretion system F family protein [Candidatus Latescibacterota bacterium]|nr:MAG: type II secretion system F family protein [Candidatus Latescibacterota bacterium]